jgi:hypothetical protein
VNPLEVLTLVGLPEQCVVLGLMLGCTAWAVARTGWLPLVGLGACVLVWARANSLLEGAVLVRLGPGHGLTLADVLVPALLGAVLLARDRRQARARAGSVD